MTTGAERTPAPGAAPATRIRFPLAWKILLWFFLNVLFLALVAVGVAQVHLRLRVDALLAGRADERLQTLAGQLVPELEGHRQTEWGEILARFADRHRVRIAVFRNDGDKIAGDIDPLPAEVLARLKDSDRRGPPDPPRGGEPFARGDFDRPPPPPREPGIGPPQRDDRPAPRDKFVLSAGSPTAYWIGLRVRILDFSGHPFGPTTVMIQARTLGAGGLLFDYTPLLLTVAGVLVCSVIFWIPLVRGMTRSVREMTHAAGVIAEGQFDTWVDGRRADELGRLGTSLNHMALRLREFVAGQKRFLGDIAHELCSPLARMEMALGVLDQRADEKQRPYVEDVREEVRQMSALVNELLSFSKAGVRGLQVELRSVPLAELARGVVVREGGGHTGFSLEIDDALRVLAEPELLARALGNVVRNAVRYAGEGGPISICGQARGAEVVLSVTDCGPGVPEDSLHRLFDPFYRPEAARTREGGGVGLGLAIVKSCVEACGGSVSARNRVPRGLHVELRLKRAEPSADPEP
jgi:two-component system sensor histidine kinase CpxA